MKFIFASILLLNLCSPLWGAENFCEALNLVNCEGIHKATRRSSARSLPSSATASQFNPANVSHDRGLGVETIYQPNNNPSFSIVTGTGKTGAALISSSLENGFFGNRIIELEEDGYHRFQDQKQYDSDKYTLALGAALFKRQKFGLDAGLLIKYNKEIKRLNPGAGLSLRMGPVTLGASVYQDDVFLKFRNLVNPRTTDLYVNDFGKETYQERFLVQSLYAGIKLQNLFLDVGSIKTKYKFFDTDQDVNITLMSASYIWKKFLLSFAVRNEESPLYKFSKDNFEIERNKQSFYGGTQYSLNKYLILGIHYNYYLLEEIAGSLTIFI